MSLFVLAWSRQIPLLRDRINSTYQMHLALRHIKPEAIRHSPCRHYGAGWGLNLASAALARLSRSIFIFISSLSPSNPP